MDKVPDAARYPIPHDDRLTDQVVELVADLLGHRGLPHIFSCPDLERLRDALSIFLYGPHSALVTNEPPASYTCFGYLRPLGGSGGAFECAGHGDPCRAEPS